MLLASKECLKISDYEGKISDYEAEKGEKREINSMKHFRGMRGTAAERFMRSRESSDFLFTIYLYFYRSFFIKVFLQNDFYKNY